LTTPEIDKLASPRDRRALRSWLLAEGKDLPRDSRAVRGTQLEKDLTRLYYTGQFEEYARRIAKSRQ
jgi:hypothetical protein